MTCSPGNRQLAFTNTCISGFLRARVSTELLRPPTALSPGPSSMLGEQGVQEPDYLFANFTLLVPYFSTWSQPFPSQVTSVICDLKSIVLETRMGQEGSMRRLIMHGALRPGHRQAMGQRCPHTENLGQLPQIRALTGRWGFKICKRILHRRIPGNVLPVTEQTCLC